MSTTTKNSHNTQNEVFCLPMYFFTGLEGISAYPAKVQPGFLEFPRGGLWACVISYEGKESWVYCDRVEKVLLEDLECGEFTLKDFGPSLSLAEYEKKIEKIKNLLREGETYQVNFAQEFSGNFMGDPLGLFCEMQRRNPSQMAFYCELNGVTICSNSPERLFSLRKVQTNSTSSSVLRAEPIKGTVGADEDASFLLRDEKSQAELTMIVDLLRNDLARVGKNVRVPVHAAIMKLANVSHTYSVVEADLMVGKTAVDVLRAIFPGGSVTGCPKIRTMKIIKRLEDFQREFYCGSAGFVLPNGDADFNIMIRTAVVRDGRIVAPAGGGILIDSNAADEYSETLKKVEIITALNNENGISN